jgi:hypothetical protein
MCSRPTVTAAISLLTAMACAGPAVDGPLGPEAPAPRHPAPAGRYEALTRRIEADRQRLAAAAAGRAETRAALLTIVADDLLPAWFGTDWDFWGTTARPGTGSIACGHFVGTVLRDAGFRVDRLAVGRLPSELIIGLFATPAERRAFRGAQSAHVVQALDDLPAGVYGVGLDTHAGLLVRRTEGAALRFCHASYVQDEVLCEAPAASVAFVSRYRVFGPLFTDRAVDAWLAASSIAVPEGW